MLKEKNHQELIIEPRRKLFDINLKDVWFNRELLAMFVKRDIVTFYKQTVFGPLWFVIQPVFTTIIFVFIFGKVAKIPTEGIPNSLFYLSGVTLWYYFSDAFLKISDTFNSNQHIFGKVYFPRLIVPLSISITGLLKLFIQLILFILLYAYFKYQGFDFAPNKIGLLFPLLLVMLAGLGLGLGIIISSLTTKYRDLKFLISFAVQLWMYLTPIVYPLSVMDNQLENLKWLVQINPLTAIMETFRYGLFGEGSFTWGALSYSIIFTVIVVIGGIILFSRVERRFMDVI